MKSGKGIDGITVEIYKMLPRSTWNVLIDICNKILPQEWCKGIILPVLKSGDASLVDNYRGITLLPTITRIFLAVLSQRTLDWAEQNNVIPIEQFGFRLGHRASDAIYILTTLIQTACTTHRQMYCCFIYFKKAFAFDSVDHQLLFHKLYSLSFDSKLFRLLVSTYGKALSCMLVNGKLTESFQCNVGVRQGCPMSPILFSFFTSDLMHALGNCGVWLENFFVPGLIFADYIVLFSEDKEGLQTSMDRLYTYCSEWKLKVNKKINLKLLHFQTPQRKNWY